MITNGFVVTEKLSGEAINEITETAQLLSVDIKELCNDENVQSLENPNQDTVSVGVNIMEDERNKFPRDPALDTSWTMYDESSESVLDALLRIFDDGNDSVF